MKECRIVRGQAQEGYRGKQGLDYFAGISAESAGSEGLCLHLLVLPPGAEAEPHHHENHESAIYVLEGSGSFRHGAHLEHVDTVEAGDFVYIPAGVPHSRSTRRTGRRGHSSPARTRTSRRASSCSEAGPDGPPAPRRDGNGCGLSVQEATGSAAACRMGPELHSSQRL